MGLHGTSRRRQRAIDRRRSRLGPDAPVELTYNWDPEVYTGGRNFGHLAIEVDDIYAYCDKLQKQGITITPLTR